MKPIKLSETVSLNELLPVVKVDNSGRSSELSELNETGQTEWIRLIEWIRSTVEACQFRKIKSNQIKSIILIKLKEGVS